MQQEFTKLKYACDGLKNLVGDTEKWLDDASVNSKNVAESATGLKVILNDCMLESTVMQEACSYHPGIGVFGSSQVGKSYLVSSFAASQDNVLYAQLGTKNYDFIQDINPQGSGKESTGLVTRFTADIEYVQDEFPVTVELLSEGDLVKIFINSYYNDLVHDPEEFDDRKKAFPDRFKAIASSLGTAREASGDASLIRNEIASVTRYVKYYHKELTRIFDDEFWEYGEREISRRPVAERIRFYELLWDSDKTFSTILKQLLEIRERIGFRKSTVHAATNSIIREGDIKHSIINVDALKSLGDSKYATRVQNSEGNAIDVDLGALAALTAELVIHVCNPKINFIRETDLLDFPGYRSRLMAEKNELNHDKVMDFFLRGKVSYLFQKYTENHLMNALIVCTNADGQVENTDMQKVIAGWIRKTQGANPDKRRGHKSSLFWALTKFDRRISTDLDKINNLEYGRSGLLQQTMLERFGQEEWLKNWDGTETSPHPFSNVVLVRKPGTSDCPFIEKENGTMKEIGVSSSFADRIGTMKEKFVNDPDVKRFIQKPDEAWDSMMNLNDGGFMRTCKLIEAVDIATVKYNAINDILREKVEQILGRLEPLVESGDEDNIAANQKNKFGRIYTYFKSNQLLCEQFGDILSLFTPTQEYIGDAYDRAVNAEALHEFTEKRSGGSDSDGSHAKAESRGSAAAVADSFDDMNFDDDDFDFDKDFSDSPQQSDASGDEFGGGAEKAGVTTAVSTGDRIYDSWRQWLRELETREAFGETLLPINRKVVSSMASELIVYADLKNFREKVVQEVDRIEGLNSSKRELLPVIKLSVANMISDFIFSFGGEIFNSQNAQFDEFGNPKLEERPGDTKKELFLNWLKQFKHVVMEFNISAKRKHELTDRQNNALKNMILEYKKLVS